MVKRTRGVAVVVIATEGEEINFLSFLHIIKNPILIIKWGFCFMLNNLD